MLMHNPTIIIEIGNMRFLAKTLPALIYNHQLSLHKSHAYQYCKI